MKRIVLPVILAGFVFSSYAQNNVGIGTNNPGSKLQISGSLAAAYANQTSTPYNLGSNDYYDAWSGASNGTFNLPAAVNGSGNFVGRVYILKNATTSYTLTVQANGSELIDGASTITIQPGNSVTLISNGASGAVTTWNVVSSTPSSGSATGWSTAGNAGTTPSSSPIGTAVNNNFAGTTDAKDFVIATNNLERMRITSAGNTGIGTTAPANTFSVGSGSPFQVSSTGAIAAATGITSSGPITFSSLAPAATSPVYINTSGQLTTTGPAGGISGYWQRTGTILSPTNAGDAISTSGAITTTNSTASSSTTTGALLVTGGEGLGGSLNVGGTITAGGSAILGTGISGGYYQDVTNGAYRSINSSSVTNGYYFQTNGGATTTMYVGLGGTYNGNVGIGTLTPGQRLSIVDAGNSNQYSGTFSVYAQNFTQGVGIGYQGIQALGSNTNQDLSFNARGTGNITMQITGTTGGVGIGMEPAANVDLAVVNNSAINIGDAYLSSGGNGANNFLQLANDEWYNGSAWTQSAAGVLYQQVGQVNNWYTHAASGGAHTLVMSLSAAGVLSLPNLGTGLVYANSGAIGLATAAELSSLANGEFINNGTASQSANFNISGYGYAANYFQSPNIYVGAERMADGNPYINLYSGNSGSGGIDLLRNDGNRWGYYYADNSGIGILGGSGNWAVRAVGSINTVNTDVQLWTNNAEQIEVNSSGYMGIGQPSPNGKLDIYNSAYNGDGAVFAPDIDLDNNFTIQTYIDAAAGGGWAGRTTYASGCCNNLALQPDVGTVSIGGTSGNYGSNKLSVIGNAYVQNTLTVGAYGSMTSTPTSYGTIGLTGAYNGYYGIVFGPSTSNPNFMWDGSGNGGIYYQNWGWLHYSTVANHFTGMGGITNPQGVLDLGGVNFCMNNRSVVQDDGDGWLRLNQNSSYSSGTYTPSFFRVDGGIASGGVGSLGAGTVWATGTIRGAGFQDYSTGYQVIDAGAGWHRSYGASGWFNGSYGGGWYMADANWIRTYGGQGILSACTNATDAIQCTTSQNYYPVASYAYGSNSTYGAGYFYGYIVAANYYGLSTRELKKDIVKFDESDYQSALSFMDDLNLNYYKFKADSFGVTKVGFIAEETPGNLTAPGKKAVSYSELSAYNTGAIKVLKKKIESLENQLKNISDFGVENVVADKFFIPFSESFKSQLGGAKPVVTVTPSQLGAQLVVSEITPDGFTVQAASRNEGLNLNWIAMAKVAGTESAPAPKYNDRFSQMLDIAEKDALTHPITKLGPKADIVEPTIRPEDPQKNPVVVEPTDQARMPKVNPNVSADPNQSPAPVSPK